MQLTKLEINGFKSFAKKTELVFEQGITGILGPNGCGKSNIADAFRFVLGEQSARALRGKKVEDYIFNGTEKRRPLSFCEVSMYFDNSDGTLDSPFSEVAVTRRAYRSGESEYFINKTACRLKDIQELFRDTGIGKDGYSIIGQGRVSEILSDRSNDRRIVFEEAAGVMKYRTRKEDAERKLQNTERNLVRLEDILHELESRIEPLREQSEKADAYFKMRDELRELELNLFVTMHDRTTEKIRQLKENAELIDSEILTASAEEESLSETCSKEETAERTLNSAISETSQKLISLTSSVESTVGETKLGSERITRLENEIKQNKTESAELEEERYINEERIAAITSALESSDFDTAALRGKLADAQKELGALSDEIEAKENAVEAQKQAMMDAMNRLADTKGRVSRLEAMRESLNGRLDAIALEKASALKETETLESEQKELRDAVDADNSAIGEIKNALLDSSGLESKIASEMNALSLKMRRSEDEIKIIDSRRKVLEEMKQAHEGYYASVRRLLNDASRDTSLSSRIHGVVAELITVPKEYERAVEMALGSALQNIIVPTEQDAKYVIEYLRKRDYGRATLLPVSAMRSRLLTSEERSFINVPGCFGVASELIGFSPAFRSAVENLLGRTVIVRDMDTGILINRRARSAFRIATLEGDILNPGGSMTGGSVQKREFSLLGRERAIEELAESRNKALSAVGSIKSEIDTAQQKLTAAAKKSSQLREKIQELNVALASDAEKLDIAEKYLLKSKDAVGKLDLEADRIRDSISEIDQQCREAEEAENLLNKDNAVTSDDIRAAQLELSNMRRQLQTANEKTAELQVLIMAADKEKNAADAEVERLKRSNASIVERIAALADGIKQKQADIEELNENLNKLLEAVGIDKDKVNSLNDELRSMENERAEHLRLLDESRERKEEVSNCISELREKLHKNELGLSKLQSDLENMAEKIWRDYEMTYENALNYKKPISAAQMHMRTDELRRSIRDLGEVNTSAIEDYRSVKERYDDLSVQCDDLRKAQSDLNELISGLTETMQAEFAEQFAKIRVNFAETFRELFGGGHAELVLSDKNDVLNSNIDIIAQPPGKKLQLLTLLSGGEQALTAIALLFAILRLKPAAFCILDEIDTSLDEANVDCFAEYLKGYSKGTQFIIITHRKGAMAVCNALYGVSMEEKGVSSIVSAKFV